MHARSTPSNKQGVRAVQHLTTRNATQTINSHHVPTHKPDTNIQKNNINNNNHFQSHSPASSTINGYDKTGRHRGSAVIALINPTTTNHQGCALFIIVRWILASQSTNATKTPQLRLPPSCQQPQPQSATPLGATNLPRFPFGRF